MFTIKRVNTAAAGDDPDANVDACYRTPLLDPETVLVMLLQECLQLLKAMLTPNPGERITLDGIMQHPWCVIWKKVSAPALAASLLQSLFLSVCWR